MASTVATTLGTPMQMNLMRQLKVSPINKLCYDESVATVMDQPPIAHSGSYRIVNPAESVEMVRDRMVHTLGLDPNARVTNIPPPPPPRRASGAAPHSPPHTGQTPARPARVSPNAIVRGR
jgi:hypothetical protein